MKYCWMSPIIRSANSVPKMQVFCAWSSLRMSACTVPRTAASVSALIRAYVWASTSSAPVTPSRPRPSPSLPSGSSPRKSGWVRPPSSSAIFCWASCQRPASARRYFSTCWSIAVWKNIARMIGAGPLMVIDTDVVGAHRSKPEYSRFMSSRVGTLTPELPTLPYTSGRVAGSSPYRVTESNAVDSRATPCPAAR